MWPEPTASPPRGWRISTDRIPLLAAIFCGVALVVCVVCALIIYKCCIMPKKDKTYCARLGENTTQNSQNAQQITYPQTAMVVETKACSSWGYTNRLVACASVQANQWYQHPVACSTMQNANDVYCAQCPNAHSVPRSTSHPSVSLSDQAHQSSIGKQHRRPRPASQPVDVVVLKDEIWNPKQHMMPEISEFSPQSTQYSSSNVLNESMGKEEDEACASSTLKTRSLPAWVRSKPRPLSTEDDLNDLYAKVNFSKKRKNRMRNDEAAIIALSKSRSQFLHKDTDSLVDNEAVIVYDERTAL